MGSGAYAYTVIALDAAGNRSSASVALTVTDQGSRSYAANGNRHMGQRQNLRGWRYRDV
ncbi:Ig domain-containing protein [Paenibacillus glycanilyticus]|uniref:Ig domain-containing protein n=1 Tax=Paenibacillus glycanilyticus TaxID=126569 RepID=UPI00203F4EFC|nr:Ig domain-containing protein [Paenibacillus glycanilyticus]MCM3627806.1 Ig domain-containing protein [Paenibacillus glycanilyticus]